MPSEPAAIEILRVATRVSEALNSLGVRHMVVGSVASSLYGDPRSTNDIDFVAGLAATQVSALAAALGDEFDVDEDALAEAMRAGGWWNIFFLPWMTKVDLFALGNSDTQQARLSRAVSIRTAAGELNVLSPADAVLSKLVWFRDGGGVSDQQWRDVLGVLRINDLDLQDLRAWAGQLGVAPLLEKALREARPG